MRIAIPTRLVVVNVLTLILLVTTVVFPNPVLRIALGIPFLLLFPGYAAVAALLPRRKPGAQIETVALSLALSLAIVPLAGMLLNYTPWGIRLQPVLVSVAAVIFLSSVIAMFRSPRSQQSDPSPPENDQAPVLRPRTWHAGVLCGIMVIMTVVAVSSLVYFAMATKGTEEFTAFYIASTEASSAGGTTQAGQGQPGSITVGIRNHEGKEVSYRVEVVINGQKSGEIGPVVLVHEQEWLGQADLPAFPGPNQKVELVLYKNQETEPYLEPLYFRVNAGG